MPTATCHQPATAPAARVYRPRRPAATLLHGLVREHLETWLATATERDECGRGVPDDALHVLDSSEHAGGWSVDASVAIPHWDRQGLEHLVRYCARPPLSQERLGRLNEQTLVYSLRRPTAAPNCC